MARPRNILEPAGLNKKIRDTTARLLEDAKTKEHRKSLPHALLADGGNLFLRVQPSTRDPLSDPPSTSWIVRYMHAGRARSLGIGPYSVVGEPEVTLAMAREKAVEVLRAVARGEDPVDQRKAQRAALAAERVKVLSFKDCALKLIASKRAGWKNAKHAAQWETTLETYVYPVIGKAPVAEIGNADVLRVLQQDYQLADNKTERLWTARPETASRVRQRIEAVLAWAAAGGHRDIANPASWTLLKHQLPEVRKLARGKVKHHKAVAVEDVPAFLTALRQVGGMSARALEFVLFTAARSGEVRGATWREIDLEKALWVIPAARMKAGREHRVPLSEPALAILRPLYQLRAGDDATLFPGQGGGPLSDMSLSAVMRRMELAAVPHGLRSSFRDWGAERTTFAPDMLELALAHTVSDKVEAAYRRGDMFAKRVQLMEAWANFCEGRSNITALAPAAA
jgi:integrase